MAKLLTEAFDSYSYHQHRQKMKARLSIICLFAGQATEALLVHGRGLGAAHSIVMRACYPSTLGGGLGWGMHHKRNLDTF